MVRVHCINLHIINFQKNLIFSWSWLAATLAERWVFLHFQSLKTNQKVKLCNLISFNSCTTSKPGHRNWLQHKFVWKQQNLNKFDVWSISSLHHIGRELGNLSQSFAHQNHNRSFSMLVVCLLFRKNFSCFLQFCKWKWIRRVQEKSFTNAIPFGFHFRFQFNIQLFTITF